MKHLNIIQKTASIIRTVVKILYIISIIGAVCCLVSLPIMIAVSGMTLDGMTFEELLAKEGVSLKEMYAEIVIGIISCAVEAVCLFFALKYLDKELKTGTPFNEEDANYLKKLSFIILGTGVALSAISALVCVCFKVSVEKVNGIENMSQLVLGALLLFMVCIFKYGANILKENKENEMQAILNGKKIKEEQANETVFETKETPIKTAEESLGEEVITAVVATEEPTEETAETIENVEVVETPNEMVMETEAPTEQAETLETTETVAEQEPVEMEVKETTESTETLEETISVTEEAQDEAVTDETVEATEINTEETQAIETANESATTETVETVEVETVETLETTEEEKL